MKPTRKRIGFVSENVEESEDGSEDFFAKMFLVSKEDVRNFIESVYTPTGSTEQKEYVTSLEIEFLLSETLDASIKVINEVMKEMCFQLEFIERVPNWVVFSKGIFSDE